MSAGRARWPFPVEERGIRERMPRPKLKRVPSQTQESRSSALRIWNSQPPMAGSYNPGQRVYPAANPRLAGANIGDV